MTNKERNDLVLQNYGLIVSTAKKIRLCDVELSDLINDGVVKFLEKAEYYNPTYGTKISTFIVPYLKQEMYGNNISIPERLFKISCKINKIIEELALEGELNPSDEDIAYYLGTNVSNVKKYLQKLEQFNALSLDTPFESDSYSDDYTLYDTDLSDASDCLPDEECLKKAEKEIIKKAFRKLSKEEQEIISFRTTYGTNLSFPLSLREIAIKKNSNRTTIGQREKAAFNHLKKILESEGIYA